MLNKKNITMAISPLLLVGCSFMHSATYTESKDLADEVVVNTNKIKGEMVSEINSGSVVADFYVDKSPIKVLKKEILKLPPQYPESISVYSAVPQTERELARVFSSDWGIDIVFNRIKRTEKYDEDLDEVDVTDATPFSGLASNDVSEGDNDNLSSPSSNVFGLFGVVDLDGGSIEDENVSPVDFTGSIPDFMDWLARDRGLSWKYSEVKDQFIVYDLDTRYFDVINNMSQYKSETSIRSSHEVSVETEDGGGQSTNSTGQSISLSENANHWEDLEGMINQMLTEDGMASFDQYNGRIVVTDYDESLDKIESFVSMLNEASSTGVLLHFNYVKVQIDEHSQWGVNLSATDMISSAVSASIGSPAVSGDLGNIYDLQFTKAGISAVIGSLSGKSSSYQNFSDHILSLNNTTVPYQSVIEETYVSKVTIEVEDDVETKIPDTAVNKSGITSTWKSRVFKDDVYVQGRFLVVENISLITDPDMNNIALPKNASATLTVDRLIPNGVGTIVSIKDDIVKKSEASGPLGEHSVAAGGQEKASSSRVISVLFVTPYII